MENKIQLIIGAIITMALLLGGTYYIAQDDDAYYCESRDMVMICEKLSSGLGTRCYYESTYKMCSEGWVKIKLDQEINTQVPGDSSIPDSTKGAKWKCSPEVCVGIE